MESTAVLLLPTCSTSDLFDLGYEATGGLDPSREMVASGLHDARRELTARLALR